MKWSAKIYTVDRVVKSRQQRAFALDKYIVKDQNNDVVLEEEKLNNINRDRQPKKFNIYDLQKIDPNTVNTRNKLIETKLNKIKYNPLQA